MGRVRAAEAGGDAGPLIAPDGRVLVDARKYPALHLALEAGARRLRDGRAEWGRVAELRAAGQAESANRLAKRLLGVQGPPMDEETKETLRRYKAEHKEEIKERGQQRRDVRARMLALLTTGGKKRR
jgi:hypothetical protein